METLVASSIADSRLVQHTSAVIYSKSIEEIRHVISVHTIFGNNVLTARAKELPIHQ